MRTSLVLLLVALTAVACGCAEEHGMYQGSQISATVALVAFVIFAFICLLGTALRGWGIGPLLAGCFVLVCVGVMLSMTPYFGLGIGLVVAGLGVAFAGWKRLKSHPQPQEDK